MKIIYEEVDIIELIRTKEDVCIENISKQHDGTYLINKNPTPEHEKKDITDVGEMTKPKTKSDNDEIVYVLKNDPKTKVHYYKDCSKFIIGKNIMSNKPNEVTCDVCVKKLITNKLIEKEQSKGHNKSAKTYSIHKKSIAGRYVCNPTTKVREERITNDWNKVTCKNCLRSK